MSGDPDDGGPGELIIKLVKFGGAATCTRPPGTVDLTGFPALIHSPDHYGPEVRTVDRWIPVREIADRFEVDGDIADVARYYGMGIDVILQACAWVERERRMMDGDSGG